MPGMISNGVSQVAPGERYIARGWTCRGGEVKPGPNVNPNSRWATLGSAFGAVAAGWSRQQLGGLTPVARRSSGNAPEPLPSSTPAPSQPLAVSAPPEDLNLTPGAAGNIDPMTLSTNKQVLEQGRLDTQKELMRNGQSQPIQVDTT